jgi:RNA 3'-terminal phosphate cyclase (ATP)
MSRLIPVDGGQGEGGGQILRTALAVASATGQGFEITRIRASRLRPGLRPQHLAAVRAAAMLCGAKVGGVFEGSPDLRFEPASVEPGSFRFEIATAGAATLVAQTVLAPLATASLPSRVEVTGGTHVPLSPSYDYVARHWAAVVERLGLALHLSLGRAGFHPRGGGELRADVAPWTGPSSLRIEERGALVEVRGISGASRLKGNVAERQSDAARKRLWEARRLDVAMEITAPPSESPGSFLLLEAIFERSRAAWGFLGQRGIRAEALGDRAARRLLAFLDAEGAVDPHLADQLAVPLALARGGGVVTTSEVTRHLETVAATLGLFGIPARTWGRRGGPGGLEVGSC